MYGLHTTASHVTPYKAILDAQNHCRSQSGENSEKGTNRYSWISQISTFRQDVWWSWWRGNSGKEEEKMNMTLSYSSVLWRWTLITKQLQSFLDTYSISERNKRNVFNSELPLFHLTHNSFNWTVVNFTFL